VLILAAGAIASALAPSYTFLLICRIILGIGIGGDYPVSATITSPGGCCSASARYPAWLSSTCAATAGWRRVTRSGVMTVTPPIGDADSAPVI
jgi:MFS family permease